MSEPISTLAPEPTLTPAPEPTPAAAGWRDGFEPDIRDNPALAKYDGPEALAKGHLEAQKLIGAKGIIRPGENATPEEMATFYGSLGRPETVEGYEFAEFKPPEVLSGFWDVDGMGKMADAMHGLGLTKVQASGLMAKWADHQAETLGETIGKMTTGKTEATEALKAKWGLAYEPKLNLARRCLTEAAVAVGVSADDLTGRYMPDGKLFGNDPVMLEIFAMIGEGNTELKFVGGKGSRTTSTPEEASTEIAKLQAHDAYADPKHPEHRVTMDRLTALFEQKHPEQTT